MNAGAEVPRYRAAKPRRLLPARLTAGLLAAFQPDALASQEFTELSLE